jgi:hypothetical protein
MQGDALRDRNHNILQRSEPRKICNDGFAGSENLRSAENVKRQTPQRASLVLLQRRFKEAMAPSREAAVCLHKVAAFS